MVIAEGNKILHMQARISSFAANMFMSGVSGNDKLSPLSMFHRLNFQVTIIF